jgi:hypothetical protein
VIEIKRSKSLLLNPGAMAALEQPLALAKATAEHIRDRLHRGQTATPADQYGTRPHAGTPGKPAYYLSPAYAERLGLGKQTRWKDSAEMHQAKGIQPGQIRQDSEMLRGMQVRNYGTQMALIEFGGSSLGASSTRTALTKKVAGSFEVTLSDNGKLRAKQVTDLKVEDGKVQYRRKPKQLLNRTKASTYFSTMSVGLLQCTDAEYQAQVDAVTVLVLKLIAKQFGTKVEGWRPTGDPQLFSRCKKELNV